MRCKIGSGKSGYSSLALVLGALTGILGGNLPSLGQDTPAKPAAEAKGESLKLAGGKVVVEKPSSWKTVPPKSNIIEYEFRAPAEGDETSRVTIMSASGGIEANITRWIGQFDGLKKSDAKLEKKEIGKTIAHIVELEGTYKESMGGGPFAPGPMKKLENHAMLGVILELDTGDTVFIKMTGPKKIVAGEREGFIKMIEGLKNN